MDMYDKILDEVRKDNDKELSVLSDKAREIVVMSLITPFQPKDLVIEKIINASKIDKDEMKIFYEEALNFINNKY